jgi:hypothetical protein
MSCSVSTSRSSNRTGGFPASGSRTGFTRRPTDMPDGRPFACEYSCFQNAWVGWLLGREANRIPLVLSTNMPELRPLCSTGITRLHRSYGPLRLRWRPDLALTGCPLAACRPPSPSVSRAFCTFLRYMLLLSTPVDRQGACVTVFPCRASLPQPTTVSASTLLFSRLRRAFTCVTACIVAESPYE